MTHAPESILYLSEYRTLFVGRIGETLSQTSSAATLIFSLEGDIILKDQSGSPVASAKSFLVPPGVELEFELFNFVIGFVFLDPLGEDFYQLSLGMHVELHAFPGKQVMLSLEHQETLICFAREFLLTKPDASQVFEIINKIIIKNDSKPTIDKRIVKAINLIKSGSAENISVEEIAHHVDLAISRFIQLFKQVTGVPLRKYRLWHRIYMTCLYAADGIPLSQAALAAGFSDYAHFSRTFKEVLGLSPSEVLKNKTNITVKVLDQLKDNS